MQTLAKNAKHIAEWGKYQVVIDDRNPDGGGAMLTVRLNYEPYQVQMAEQQASLPEAVMAAANFLEKRGCHAQCDGQHVSLAHILHFVPDGVR